ncbi:MAG: response regulator [bacterium]|nr:response regulator [bacterium]
MPKKPTYKELEARIRELERALTGHRAAEQANTQALEKQDSNLALLRMAGNTARFGGWSVDLRKNIVTWSEAVADIHKMPKDYSPSVEEGARFYTPEWREKIMQVFTGCAEKGIPYDEEMEIITQEGKRIWVRTIGEAVRDKHGTIVRVQGAFQDISQRKQNEEALRKEFELRTALLDNLPNCIALILKKDTREIIASNKLAHEMGAIPGKTCFGTCASRDDNCPFCLAQALWETGKIQHVETKYKGVWYEGIWAPLSENLYVHYIIDITERKKAEVVKRQLKKSESLGRMAGAIAHHYNNLLHIIIGNLEMAGWELSPESEPGLRIQSALSASNRASEISSLMLVYLGQSNVKFEPLDLTNSCRLALPSLIPGIPSTATLRSDLPACSPTVMANNSQIQQLLKTLLTNAWESLEDQPGIISLSIRTVYPADIPTFHRRPTKFPAEAPAYTCIEVTDTGCGIEEDDIEKLFDPFYSTKFTGRGLGLPVALGMVRSSEGCTTVESTPGQGSSFRVYLPQITRETRPASCLGTLLLVDDEPDVRDMTKGMLTLLGIKVLEAKDGIEALEIFKKHRDDICCVLCDVSMPNMDGWETLTALRQIAPDIHVTLASGYDFAHVMAEDHPEQPQAFLHKPFTVNELKNALPLFF